MTFESEDMTVLRMARYKHNGIWWFTKSMRLLQLDNNFQNIQGNWIPLVVLIQTDRNSPGAQLSPLPPFNLPKPSLVFPSILWYSLWVSGEATKKLNKSTIWITDDTHYTHFSATSMTTKRCSMRAVTPGYLPSQWQCHLRFAPSARPFPGSLQSTRGAGMSTNPTLHQASTHNTI